MSTLRRRVAVPLALVVALATVPALTGCGSNPIQSLVKSATGGKVDVSSGGSVPAGFPSAVPLYKGKVDSGVGVGSGKSKIWTVTIEVPGSSSIKDIKSELTAAKFSALVESTGGSTGGTIVAKSGSYGVLVVVSKGDKGWIANYTVTPVTTSK
jgi:hypothetical protein